MIEGLKPTVSGTKLRDLCLSRCEYHSERAQAYADQLESMERAQIEGMHYSNGDPKRPMQEKRNHHLADADEMLFLAENIDLNETYVLDSADLARLGIRRNGHY